MCKAIHLLDTKQTATVTHDISSVQIPIVITLFSFGKQVITYYLDVAYRNGHSREVHTHASLGPALAHVEVEVPDTVIQVSLQCLVKLKMK